jgi:hypothetical protein
MTRRDVFGERAVVQRCQVHKARNVRDRRPEKRRTYVARQIRDEYDSATAATAKRKLFQLASWLDSNGQDDAAASLRESLDETLTVMRFGLTGTLRRTFATTNPIANMNGSLRRVARNVKRWKDDAMIRRWAALGIAQAQKGFRRVKGYVYMPSLIAALRPAAATVASEKKSRNNPSADDRRRFGRRRTRAMSRGAALAALALTLLNCGGKQVGSTGAEAGAQVGSIGTAAAVLAACSVSQEKGDPCPPSLCGNGHIDTCPGGDSLTELCDGLDLGSRTCATLGYFGGTLACTSSCDLDEEGCVSCGSDARISACVRSAAGTAPAGLSLAATTTEIDVAWNENAPSIPTPDLHFSRYRSDFTLLSDTRCFGPADASLVGVAALGNGWVVGTLTGSNTNAGGGVYLVRLDGEGRILGSRTVANEAGSPFGFRLTTGPSGGALVTWIEGRPNNQVGNLHAELLASDGSSAWSAIVVGANVEFWSAVSTGDGFVLAVEWDPGLAAVPPTASRFIQLFRLGLDGSLSSGASIPGFDPAQVGLAWNGSEVRLWYQAREVDTDSGSPNAGSQLQRVAKDGTLVGAPVVVEAIEESGPMLLFTAGADTVLLRTDYGVQYLVRLSASGTTAWPEVPAIQAGAGGAAYFGLDMVSQGGDAVVAWGEGAALSFERIRISP